MFKLCTPSHSSSVDGPRTYLPRAIYLFQQVLGIINLFVTIAVIVTIIIIIVVIVNTSLRTRHGEERPLPAGGMIRLETLIELKFIDSSFSSSNFSNRASRAYPLIGIRQSIPYRANRGKSSHSSRLYLSLLTVSSLPPKHPEIFVKSWKQTYIESDSGRAA